MSIRSLWTGWRRKVEAETERQAAIREIREDGDAYMESIRRPQAEVDAMMAQIREDNHRRYEQMVQQKIAERRARAK